MNGNNSCPNPEARGREARVPLRLEGWTYACKWLAAWRGKLPRSGPKGALSEDTAQRPPFPACGVHAPQVQWSGGQGKASVVSLLLRPLDSVPRGVSVSCV